MSINLSTSSELWYSMVEFNADLKTVYFGSIDNMGYFNVFVSKEEEKLTGKKGWHCAKPISQQKVDASC